MQKTFSNKTGNSSKWKEKDENRLDLHSPNIIRCLRQASIILSSVHLFLSLKSTQSQRSSVRISCLFMKLILEPLKLSKLVSKRSRTIHKVVARFRIHMQIRARFINKFIQQWNERLADRIEKDFKNKVLNSPACKLYVSAPARYIAAIAQVEFDQKIRFRWPSWRAGLPSRGMQVEIELSTARKILIELGE